MTIISAPHLYHLYPPFFFFCFCCLFDIPEPLTTATPRIDLLLSQPSLQHPPTNLLKPPSPDGHRHPPRRTGDHRLARCRIRPARRPTLGAAGRGWRRCRRLRRDGAGAGSGGGDDGVAGRAPHALAIVLAREVEVDGGNGRRAPARLRHGGKAEAQRDGARLAELARRRDGGAPCLGGRQRRRAGRDGGPGHAVVDGEGGDREGEDGRSVLGGESGRAGVSKSVTDHLGVGEGGRIRGLHSQGQEAENE